MNSTAARECNGDTEAIAVNQQIVSGKEKGEETTSRETSQDIIETNQDTSQDIGTNQETIEPITNQETGGESNQCHRETGELNGVNKPVANQESIPEATIAMSPPVGPQQWTYRWYSESAVDTNEDAKEPWIEWSYRRMSSLAFWNMQEAQDSTKKPNISEETAGDGTTGDSTAGDNTGGDINNEPTDGQTQDTERVYDRQTAQDVQNKGTLNAAKDVQNKGTLTEAKDETEDPTAKDTHYEVDNTQDTKPPQDTKDVNSGMIGLQSFFYRTEETSWNWFSWFAPKEVETDDDSLTGEDAELYRSAKMSLESSKKSQYALKCTKEGSQMSMSELAVSETLTESNPVRLPQKKIPLTPNETSELSLAPLVEQEAVLNPQFSRNFRHITVKTKIRLRSEELFGRSTETHLYRSSASRIAAKKKGIKKVLVIGIHGFLPIKFVRTLIGSSTGNSRKFVNGASLAIEKWLEDPPTIHTIALEGEGTIPERVGKLVQLLDNWKEVAKECDLILMASHSSGVPVAVHVFAEILSRWEGEGMVMKNKKLGLLSMGGMLSGPHLGLDSKVVIRAYSASEKALIDELFELQRPNSPASIQLDRNIQKLADDYNVKITLGAAADDQLVSLTSALGTKYQHPNIFRTMLARKECEVPQFVVKFVGAMITMLNMGHSPSPALLTAMNEICVGTGGHCGLFQSSGLYMTAVKHAMESTSLVKRRRLSVQQSRYSYTKVSTNAFDIVWGVRELMERLVYVKNIGNLSILEGLLESYREWAPKERIWKEVKQWFSGLEEFDIEEFLE